MALRERRLVVVLVNGIHSELCRLESSKLKRVDEKAGVGWTGT